MRFLFIFSLLISLSVHAEKFNLEELISFSENNSPLLKTNHAKQAYTEAAKELSNSYYFPIFNFTQRYVETNNPVQAFGLKLMQEKFTPQDFAIDKLNNPDKIKAHQSSFNLYVPVDVFGVISSNKKVINHLGESVVYEEKWIKKEIKKNLSALYHAYFHLTDLQSFFTEEMIFLKKIIKLYDSKSDANKNRYLSFNQARIIGESLQEGIETLNHEKNKILRHLSFISGIDQIELVRVEDKLKDPKQISLKQLERHDLNSMEKYLDSLKAEIDKDKKSYFPELSLFGQYNLTSEKFNENHGKDTTVGAQLSFTFGLSTPKKISLTTAKSMQAKYEYEDKVRQVKTDIDIQSEELKKINTSLKYMENRHNIFKENKKILSYQYQRGSVELYNLLDNFIAYIQNYSDFIKLSAEYQAKLANYQQNFQE